MADFEWQSFFLDVTPEPPRSKVALSIFDAPDSVESEPPEKKKEPKPKAEEPKAESKPEAPASIFETPSAEPAAPAEEKPKETPEEGGQPYSPPAGAQDSGKWEEFLNLFYEGGKKKVKNPNAETKDKYPEVQLSTALKDQMFAHGIQQEFHAWLQQGKEDDPASDAPAVEEKPKSEQKKKPKVGTKVESLDQVVPGMFIENAWGTVGKVTSMLPDGGFRYRQFDKITNKWKGTTKIDKAKAEQYFSGQSFTVTEDPAQDIPKGSTTVHGTDVTPGDTVWFNGDPRKVKKVEEDPNKHGYRYQLEDGTWVNMHDVEGPKMESPHSYVYHQPGDPEPEPEPSAETPKPKKKEKVDVGDKVETSSQLTEGDWLESFDADDPSEKYLGKVTEVVEGGPFGEKGEYGPGVMIQDYSAVTGKMSGKPWFLSDEKLPEGDTTKVKPPKVKKGLTGKEVTDSKKLQEGDVLRIHEYDGGKTYTAQVIKNDDGWIVYNIVNPKTGKVSDTRTVSPQTFADELQVARLPASKVPKKLKPMSKTNDDGSVNPFALVMEQHAEKELAKAKAKSKEQTEDLQEDADPPAAAPKKDKPKGKTKKVDKGKWKLQTEQVGWDDIKVGDMVHTADYGPQRVVGHTGSGVRLESGVVLTKSQLKKDKGQFTVSRGDKPQKAKAPPIPERPQGKLVSKADTVQEGDVIEYEHNGTTYRGEVVSWDTLGEKFRVRIIYPPEYVAKYETYDEATGEKKFKTPSFDQAKIDKRKPRILSKDEMKAYDAKVKGYTQKIKDIDKQYSEDVAEYEAAMSGQETVTTGPLQHLEPPKDWNHDSTIAHDADRFFEQYKAMLGDKIESIVGGMSSGKSYWSGTSAMWDEMSEGERKLAQSAHDAAPEFRKLLTTEEWSAWQSALSTWQGSSGGSTAHTLMGGLENLGVEGGPKYFESSNVQHYREEGRKNEALHRAISKAMAYSQLVYDALGVKDVSLYRGTKTKPVQGAEQGKKITTTTARELASFSIDPQVAYSFAGGDKRVVRYRVPVSRLFISPITFAPLSSAKSPHSENEYVVAGQDGMEGKVMPQSLSSFSSSKMKLAAYERRPLFGPVLDDEALIIEFEPEDDAWLRAPVKETWWPSYCNQYDQWAEEYEPRVASKILRLARQHSGFRRELLAVLHPVKKATTVFDAPDTKMAVSIFDAPDSAAAPKKTKPQEPPKQGPPKKHKFIVDPIDPDKESDIEGDADVIRDLTESLGYGQVTDVHIEGDYDEGTIKGRIEVEVDADKAHDFYTALGEKGYASWPKPKPPSNGGTFDEWFAKKYDGGKKKVQNPNPETKDKYPEVATSTAMKDKAFAAKVYAEYQQETGQEAQPKPQAAPPKAKSPKPKVAPPEEGPKALKPSDLKVGDKIRYSYKGNEFVGDIVSAEGGEVRANLYHPKTGKKLRFKPVTINAEKLKEWGAERADDWHRPPPPKIKPGVRLVVPDEDLDGQVIEVADKYQDDEGKWILKDTAGVEWNWEGSSGGKWEVAPEKPKKKEYAGGLTEDEHSYIYSWLETVMGNAEEDGKPEKKKHYEDLQAKLYEGKELTFEEADELHSIADDNQDPDLDEDYVPSAVEKLKKLRDSLQPEEKPKAQELLDIDAGGFKQVGHQTGSNPGGLYEDKQGERYYVKTPKSEDRGRNEILAGKLYGLADIAIPELTPATRDGKFSVASKIVPGLSENAHKLRSGDVPGVLEGIAVDAWLGNWDVVGLEYDNLLVDEEGNGRRVDTGGALRYRAMGAPKGDAFGDEVTELDTFTDPDRKSGSVFHHATPQQIVDSIDRVLDIPEDKIRELVDQWGPQGKERDKLFKTLLARRESLKKQREKYAEKAAEKKAAARVLMAALRRPEFRKALLREVRG